MNQAEFEIKFFEGVVERRPDYVDALIPLAAAYTRKGRVRDGLAVDRKLSRLLREDPLTHYNLGCSYALTGQKKRALAAIRKALRLGYRDIRHLKEDQDLKNIHNEPEFKTLLEHLSKSKG